MTRRRELDLGGPGEPASWQRDATEIADFVRRCYVSEFRRFTGMPHYGTEELPAWDGGEDRWGAVHKPVWTRLARFFVAEQIDPIVYINLQFTAALGREPPRPNMLTGPDAMQRYRRFMQNAVEEFTRSFKSQALSLETMLTELRIHTWMTDEQRMTIALMDERLVQATPLFRYGLAKMANLSRVLAYYHDQALYQYAFQSAQYDAAWDPDMIPDDLRQEAAAVRAAY